MYSHEITNLRVIPFGNIFASLWFSVLSAPHSPKGVVRKPWQLHTMYMRFISFLEHYFVNFPERPKILNSLGLSVHILKIIANFSKITKKVTEIIYKNMHMFLSLSDFPATFNYRSGQGVQNLRFHVFFYHCFSMEKLSMINGRYK